MILAWASPLNFHSGLFSELRYMSNGLILIFGIVAKWLDNNGYKISWQSQGPWELTDWIK